MGVWSLAIASSAFLVSIISLIYSRRSWSESNRPLVTARVSSLGMGGNVAIPLSIIVENTGNRPAKNVQLFCEHDKLKAAFAGNGTEEFRRQVEACFSDQGFIPVVANGKFVSNSFGVLCEDEPTWTPDAKLDIEVSYQDLDGRRFKYKMPLKIAEDSGFASGFWK